MPDSSRLKASKALNGSFAVLLYGNYCVFRPLYARDALDGVSNESNDCNVGSGVCL